MQSKSNLSDKPGDLNNAQSIEKRHMQKHNALLDVPYPRPALVVRGLNYVEHYVISYA